MISIPWATLFRLILLAVALVGLAYTWISLAGRLNPLVLFTVQSNLMLAGYYSWRVACGRRPSAEVKGAVTLYIVMTGLVWHFLRMRGASPFEHLSFSGFGLGNFLLHYVTPAMAVIDWLVFDRAAARPKWTTAVVWLVYPATYLIFALVRGALLPPHSWKRYPYPFLNVDRFGYDGVSVMAVVLATCFVLLGCGLIALQSLVDRAAVPVLRRRSASPP